MSDSESRNKTQLVQVRCTPVEKLALKERADAFGVSVGELCRNAIFGSIPQSKTDKDARRELAATRADLGRLGGLLKGWLGGKFSQATPIPRTHAEVEALIQEIKLTQVKVMDAVKNVTGKP
jgi:predicted aconitase